MIIHNFNRPDPIRPDRDDTVIYTEDHTEYFDIDVDPSDLTTQPPWHGVHRITNITIQGDMNWNTRYEVVSGHRDPSTQYDDDVEFTNVQLDLFAHDGGCLVASIDLGDFSDGDAIWGRLADGLDLPAAYQPFVEWLRDNREIGAIISEAFTERSV